MTRRKTWPWWQRFWAQDWLAILAAAILIATGLAFIYSASWRGEEIGLAGGWAVSFSNLTPPAGGPGVDVVGRR
mgnify:CR=1 FL=1